jgi:hypothetical protein
MRSVISAAAVSTVVLLVGWAGYQALGLQEFDEVDTGEAMHGVASPGDTMIVFGGRADLQLTSGMPSPYEHLWSLPMRTMDPELKVLESAIDSTDPPTWIIEWVPFDTWSKQHGTRLGTLVSGLYTAHGHGCGATDDDQRIIWIRNGLHRPAPDPACHGG